MPTGNLSTTWKVALSITQTSPDLVFGTYAYALDFCATGPSMFAPASE